MDFPDSPRVPKGKGKKSKESPQVGTTSIGDSNGTEDDGGLGERGKQVTFGSPSLKQRESDITSTDSEVTTIMATQTQGSNCQHPYCTQLILISIYNHQDSLLIAREEGGHHPPATETTSNAPRLNLWHVRKGVRAHTH